MIKNYKLFLESRRQPISKQEAINIIKSNCKEFLVDKKTKIFRGVDSDEDPDFVLVKPSEGLLRRSANTSNHYTLIIDNSERWSHFPKRSKSIICTTSPGHAHDYGHAYCVIPFDNANIGICPENDIWTSFVESGIHNLDSFVYDLSKLGISDYDFESMVSDFKKIEAKLISKEIEMSSPSKLATLLLKTLGGHTYNWDFGRDTSTIVSNYMKLEPNHISLFEYVDELFDPTENGFKTSSYRDMNYTGDDLEVWTDSNCIMISLSVIDSILEELN